MHVDLKSATGFNVDLWYYPLKNILAKSVCCSTFIHICSFLEIRIFGSILNCRLAMSNPSAVVDANQMLRIPSGRRKTRSIHATALLKSKLTAYNWNLPRIKVHKFPKIYHRHSVHLWATTRSWGYMMDLKFIQSCANNKGITFSMLEKNYLGIRGR